MFFYYAIVIAGDSLINWSEILKKLLRMQKKCIDFKNSNFSPKLWIIYQMKKHIFDLNVNPFPL